MIRALAVSSKRGELETIEYGPGPLAENQVEIEVMSCGICHSDLSMIDNEWGNATYPLVPGHEVVGKVNALGTNVKHLKVGQVVGVGWFAGSCMTCPECMDGQHHLCGKSEQTIVGRHGGFASRVRVNGEWAIPLPDRLDARTAGPLFCGGITVFGPIMINNVRPTDRVGVIGIGGLGHLALQFLNKWGCEVYAFSSTEAKSEEARRMGAHHVISSKDKAKLGRLAGSLDFILSTVNVPLDWDTYLSLLRPRGTLHFVGAVLEPIPVQAFSLISGQKRIAGSPLGSPETVRKMLDFCARHSISPVTEHYPMTKANDAIQHLRDGKARYRIILENDF